MNTHCKRCKKPLTVPAVPGYADLVPIYCDECGQMTLEEDDLRWRITRFNILCPPLYAGAQFHLLPDKEASARVIQWRYQSRGLLLHGPSRTGKSMTAWLLIKRLVHDQAIKVAAYTAGEFARQIALSITDNGTLVEYLSRIELLFLDDLGKFKLTERVEADLFEIVEARCANKLPCLFTTNMVGKDLEAAMSGDRSTPFVARLREFCETISFA